jgi:PilZ domain-containing protein
VPDSCTVLIAAPDLLPALKERAAREGGELLAFTDADALRALETIMKRRPSVVALERAFAATPRGAALINRIKADPSLARSDIRVISHEAEPLKTGAHRAGDAMPVAVADPPLAQAERLDETGTRRAQRTPVAKGLELLIDGNAATLIDLSAVGAQVLSPTTLRPNQRVRVTLADEQGTLRMNGVIAWASFEIPHRYRAGIDFSDADAAAIDAYARRHQEN